MLVFFFICGFQTHDPRFAVLRAYSVSLTAICFPVTVKMFLASRPLLILFSLQIILLIDSGKILH